jgi:dephospho-CoA kinase
MDKLVVVFADEEQQLGRLMERDGLNREQALARIRSQMPLAEKRMHADYVIDNRGVAKRPTSGKRLLRAKRKRRRNVKSPPHDRPLNISIGKPDATKANKGLKPWLRKI